MAAKLNTVVFKQLLGPKLSDAMYERYSIVVPWEESVKSKKYGGSTRLGYAVDTSTDLGKEIEGVVNRVLSHLNEHDQLQYSYGVLGTYLNYYLDGSYHTPSHSHKGQHQLVISLGATRTLKVNSKEYKLEHGDVIIFGSGPHSVPIESEVKEGRISLATFMLPLNK